MSTGCAEDLDLTELILWDKNVKKKVHVPQYPAYSTLASDDELRVLLARTRLDKFYSCIDWTWNPTDYIAHFSSEAKVVAPKGDFRTQKRVIKYFPRDCGTPIHITMKTMAKTLGLSLIGLNFQVASVDDDVKRQKYFKLFNTGVSRQEHFFPTTSARSHVLKVVGRFASQVIYVHQKSTTKISITCMRHLQHALEGKEVAWGIILWESFLKRITAFQSKPLDSSSDKDNFGAVVVALLANMEPGDHPDLKAWWTAFKSTKPSEFKDKIEAVGRMSGFDHDDPDGEDADVKNVSKQDIVMTDNLGQLHTDEEIVDDRGGHAKLQVEGETREERTMVDDLTQKVENWYSKVEHKDSDPTSTDGDTQIQGDATMAHHLTQELQDCKLKVESEEFASLQQGGHVLSNEGEHMVDNLTTEEDEELNVAKRTCQLQDALVMGRQVEDAVQVNRPSEDKPFHDLRVVKSVESQSASKNEDFVSVAKPDVLEGECQETTSKKKLAQYAKQQPMQRVTEPAEIDGKHAEIESDSICDRTLTHFQTSDQFAHGWERSEHKTSGQGPKLKPSELINTNDFHEGLDHVQPRVLQKTADDNILLPFGVNIDNAKLNQVAELPSCSLNFPIKKFKPSPPVRNSLVDSSFKESELKGRSLEEQVKDTSRQLNSIGQRLAKTHSSKDLDEISNELNRQQNLITSMTERATELEGYLCIEKGKRDSIYRLSNQRDPELDKLKVKWNSEQNRISRLNEQISDLRKQRAILNQQLLASGEMAEQLNEHADKIHYLKKENVALKRKMERIEETIGTPTDSNVKHRLSVSKGIKKFKMSLEIKF